MATRLAFYSITEEQCSEAHEKFGSVYLILDADNNRVKIGHSRHPLKRLRQLQTGSSAKLILIGVIAAAIEVEKRLHDEMHEHHVHSEWFSGGEDAVKWLNRQTGGAPMCRTWARLVPAREINVFWEWDAEHNVHHKHVFDPEKERWVGPLMHSGKPNARPGWSSTTTELAAI